MSKFDEGTKVVVRTPNHPTHKHHEDYGFVHKSYVGHWIAVRFGDGDLIVYLPKHVHEMEEEEVTTEQSAASTTAKFILNFDDAVHEEAQRLGGVRESLELVIDSEIRHEIAKLQLEKDQRRVMTTWQGLDLVELAESMGGYWKIRRKA